MATAELKDDATHEEIQEFVDQAVKDIEEDRKGEQVEKKTEGKADAKQLAEEQDEQIMNDAAVKEHDSDDDTADEGDETGDSEGQAQEWLDDDLKAEVAAYGIDEKDLAEFSSREELERAIRFFDRAAYEAGRKAQDESSESQAKDDDRDRDKLGRFVKDKDDEAKEGNEGRYEIGLDEDADVYGEDLVEELTRMHNHYDSRLVALESQLEAVHAEAEEAKFDAAVDAMGRKDLFGVTGKETSSQLKRRQELMPRVQGQANGLERVGVQLDYRKLVLQTAKGLFADEFFKKELKDRTRKLSKQSNSRMGGGSTKSAGPEESLEEWAERRYKELENA